MHPSTPGRRVPLSGENHHPNDAIYRLQKLRHPFGRAQIGPKSVRKCVHVHKYTPASSKNSPRHRLCTSLGQKTPVHRRKHHPPPCVYNPGSGRCARWRWACGFHPYSGNVHKKGAPEAKWDARCCSRQKSTLHRLQLRQTYLSPVLFVPSLMCLPSCVMIRPAFWCTFACTLRT